MCVYIYIFFITLANQWVSVKYCAVFFLLVPERQVVYASHARGCPVYELLGCSLGASGHKWASLPPSQLCPSDPVLVTPFPPLHADVWLLQPCYSCTTNKVIPAARSSPQAATEPAQGAACGERLLASAWICSRSCRREDILSRKYTFFLHWKVSSELSTNATCL